MMHTATVCSSPITSNIQWCCASRRQTVIPVFSASRRLITNFWHSPATAHEKGRPRHSRQTTSQLYGIRTLIKIKSKVDETLSFAWQQRQSWVVMLEKKKKKNAQRPSLLAFRTVGGENKKAQLITLSEHWNDSRQYELPTRTKRSPVFHKTEVAANVTP